MAGTLRDDLASLKIERGGREPLASRPPTKLGKPRSGGGLGWLAILLWMIPLALIGFAGSYAYLQYEKIRTKTKVSVGLVQAMTTGEAEKLLSAKGYLKARHQADIGAKIPGRLLQINVEERSKVKKGDLLAVLEHRELDAQLASRLAMVKKTEADIAEARVDLRQKERETQRAQRLYNARTVSIEEAEKSEASRGMAEARLQSLEAQLALQKAAVDEVQASIENMKLYAPFDGTVVDKQAEVGDIVTPSAFTALTRSAVVTLASLEEMEVETDVAESLLSRISEGQPAEVSVSAVPDRRYRGRLRQIIPKSDRTRNQVKVKVSIVDPDDRLFPELMATVHFLPDASGNKAEASKSFLFVPKAAVFEQNGHTYAWVVDGRSRLTRREVAVAFTNEALARVESGLKADEKVVLDPADSLRENETVKVEE